MLLLTKKAYFFIVKKYILFILNIYIFAYLNIIVLFVVLRKVHKKKNGDIYYLIKHYNLQK